MAGLYDSKLFPQTSILIYRIQREHEMFYFIVILLPSKKNSFIKIYEKQQISIQRIKIYKEIAQLRKPLRKKSNLSLKIPRTNTSISELAFTE